MTDLGELLTTQRIGMIAGDKVVVEMPGHIRSDDPLRNLVRQAQ